MLDTVLAIGKALRSAPDGLKYHRYIKAVPADPKNTVQYWTIPCSLDGSFDFSRRTELIDENRQRQLLYLNYKTTDADSSKKYIYGDIYRLFKRDAKHPEKSKEAGGNFIAPPRKDSFLNGMKDIESLLVLQTSRLKQFRANFQVQSSEIYGFLQANDNVYLHFDFEGRHWYQLEEWDAIEQAFLHLFFRMDTKRSGYSLRSFLFKALSHDSEDAARLPGFQKDGGSHQARLFKDKEEAMSLFYGVDSASSAVLRRNDIKVIVLPCGENLTWKPLTQFFDRKSNSETDSEIEAEEEQLERENADEQDILSVLDRQGADQFVQFDFILSQAGGTKADIDRIELSGLQRSKLNDISKCLRATQDENEAKRAAFLSPSAVAKLSRLNILRSFLNLLGDATKAKKKYQSHLLRVLPQILTETYYRDPILLPALVEKTEFNLRNGKSELPFNLLKFDFYFLSGIQNGESDHLMEIQTSPSYKVGVLLGKLAKQFSGPSSPIKSFEKNYVGLLSRRIGNLPDVMQLSNEINQKLVMHELSRFTFRVSTELADELKNFPGRYDKNECAFGFFESYFAPLPQKEGEHDEEKTNKNKASDLIERQPQ